jgi:hypothetical protein
MVWWILFVVLWLIYVVAVRSKLSGLSHRLNDVTTEINAALNDRRSLVSDLPGIVRAPTDALKDIFRQRDALSSDAPTEQKVASCLVMDQALGKLKEEGTIIATNPAAPTLLDTLALNRERLSRAADRYNDLANDLNETIHSFPSRWASRGYRRVELISSAKSAAN